MRKRSDSMKKAVIIILLSFLIVFFSSLQYNHSESEKRNIDESNIGVIQQTENGFEDRSLERSILQSVKYIEDTEELVCEALEFHLDEKYPDEIQSYIRVIRLLEKAQREIDTFTIGQSSSQLYSTIQLLIRDYKHTVTVIRDIIVNGMTANNADQYHVLMNSAIIMDSNLRNYSKSFAYLYYIQKYDEFTDEDVEESLGQHWNEFHFVGTDELMPEDADSFDNKELYYRWARSFKEDFEQTGEFEKALDKLRSSDSMTPEYNEKWFNFMRQYLFNTEEDDLANIIYQENEYLL